MTIEKYMRIKGCHGLTAREGGKTRGRTGQFLGSGIIL
jgi:hypothetical protein